MDLDNSSASASPAATVSPAADVGTPPPAGKVRCCICERRMSSLTHDFHSLCTDCHGRDCDLDIRCEECIDVADDVMLAYVKHRLSLQRKSPSKQRLKSTVPVDVPAVDVVVGADAAVSPSPD